jgi:nucleoside permease NupC
MTESELHAIMAGGMATIAGSVFGIYVSFGTYTIYKKSADVLLVKWRSYHSRSATFFHRC